MKHRQSIIGSLWDVVVQSKADSPLDIYNALIADATFMSYVGTYTFNDGSTEDAISIVTPGQSLPQLDSISGLEVVIHDVGTIRRQDYISEQSDPLTTWKVYLIAWEGAAGADVNTAGQHIVRRFGGSNMIEISSTGTTIGAFTQGLLLIPSNGIII